MRGRRRHDPPLTWLLAAAGAVALAAGTSPARAQATGLGAASDLESAGSYRQAATAYRGALGGADLASALLGLERVYAAIGWTDSLLPLLDSLIGQRPTDPLLQSVRLRALTMTGQERRAQTMFDQWVDRSQGDPRPFREYARLLLDGGRITAADSVLRRAQGALGSGRAVALELAQLRAQMGLWELSARSWREALEDSPYLVQAAVFALQPTTAAARDPVRAALGARPPLTAASQALARLELAWGDPAAGWRGLASLPATDSTVDAWIAFAGEAAAADASATAADALAAAARARPSAGLRARAADAALRAGRPDQALALTGSETEGDGPAADSAARLLLPVRVRALSALGRPQDAARLVDDAARGQPQLAAGLQRELAWAWVRAGELERARAALARAGADPEDEVHGWLALYAGDLSGARRMLRATDGAPAYVVTALALLGRTRADSAPAVGEAFLALARGDSAAAATAFARAAAAVPDAAPLLLASSARLAAGGDQEAAIAAWRRIIAEFPASPEAAEPDLGWARVLGRRGDAAGVRARLEHLILSYPESALVPQARRELELLSASTGDAPPPSRPPPAPPAAAIGRPPS